MLSTRFLRTARVTSQRFKSTVLGGGFAIKKEVNEYEPKILVTGAVGQIGQELVP